MKSGPRFHGSTRHGLTTSNIQDVRLPENYVFECFVFIKHRDITIIGNETKDDEVHDENCNVDKVPKQADRLDVLGIFIGDEKKPNFLLEMS